MLRNAFDPIEVNGALQFTVTRLLLLRKASVPIEVTLLGIVMLVRPVQLKNA